MNANGTEREFLVKTLDEKEFSDYVLQTIEGVLTEQHYKAEIISVWNEPDDSIVAVLHIDHNIFSIGIGRKTISDLKQAGPYMLDRYLWKLIQEQGIHFNTDHYLYTVFSY